MANVEVSFPLVYNSLTQMLVKIHAYDLMCKMHYIHQQALVSNFTCKLY